MPTLIKKAIDPARWRRFAESRLDLYRRNRGDDALDRALAGLGPVEIEASEKTLIADGLWFNPNHFFRLRLFVQALADRGECLRLLGVLRRHSDARASRALER